MKSVECRIKAWDQRYAIEIASKSITIPTKIIEYIRNLKKRIAIISDHTVEKLYAEPFRQQLVKAGLDVELFTFPSGDSNKTRSTKEFLENQLFEKKFDRQTCLLALGGGVVTDLTGYLAATYCRGVPFVSLPTSLLAMVDACIGGKTGVNLPYGKNLMGCIHHPIKVFIDPSLLNKLPKIELHNGFSEMIKHGLIVDANYFEFLESKKQELLNLNNETMEKAIYLSCCIKKNIIESDEKENGQRRLLNFGHTIGHALEHLTNYGLAHGEAVAIGLLVESYLSKEMGYLDIDTFKKIQNLLHNYQLPLRLPQTFSTQALLQAMELDKKSVQGKPRFVILKKIGSSLDCKGDYCMEVEMKALIKTLEWMNETMFK